MSNTYKSNLQANNVKLQLILDMINGLGQENTVTLITFTVAGVEYQAEEGMTWTEWCDSEYNTDNFEDQGCIGNPSGEYISTSLNYGDQVSSTDEIINGTEYVLWVP